MPDEDRYTWLFRRLPVIASLMDVEGRFTDVSDEWVSRLGYSREEMLGRRPEDIATPESARVIWQDHLPRFRRIGRLDHVSVDFVTKSGETIEMLATTIAEKDAKGQFLHSLSVFTELSDRNKLERRYLDLYQSTPAMLHTVDSQGRVTTVSDYWLEKLGYEREEVIGRSAFDFLTEGSRAHASQSQSERHHQGSRRKKHSASDGHERRQDTRRRHVGACRARPAQWPAQSARRE